MSIPKIVRPVSAGLLHLTVQRTQRLSPGWMRVTLGGGDIDRFTPMGYDQWFRLFLPLGGEAALERVPPKANGLLGYLKFLRIPDGVRPVMRNYSVRSFRPATADAGAELDVDFVLHGSAAEGTVIVEGPDLPDFPHPAGIEVVRLPRTDAETPGALALSVLRELTLPSMPFHAYIAGEQALASGARRYLVGERDVEKDRVSFTGYWKLGASSPASRASREVASRPAA